MSDRLNQPTPPVVAGIRLTSRLLPVLFSTFRVPSVIVIARFMPGLLTVSLVAAGGLCISYGAFVLGIVLSSIIGDILVLAVGFITNHGLRILGITPLCSYLLLFFIEVITIDNEEDSNIQVIFIARGAIRER